jgi:hypothetical protein
MAHAVVASFTPLKPGLDLRAVNVELLMDRVALGQVLSLSTLFSRIILHIRSIDAMIGQQTISAN